MNPITPVFPAIKPHTATLPLSTADRKELRASAHHLSPLVIIGDAGLTPGVMKEIAVALKAHALIKIRVVGDDREARVGMLEQITTELKCGAVQTIGKLLVIYKPKPEAKPKEHLPKKMAAMGLTEKPRKRNFVAKPAEEDKSKKYKYSDGYQPVYFEDQTRPGRAPKLGTRNPPMRRTPRPDPAADGQASTSGTRSTSGLPRRTGRR
jgi:putative YhbY family RNA-binding protein